MPVKNHVKDNHSVESSAEGSRNVDISSLDLSKAIVVSVVLANENEDEITEGLVELETLLKTLSIETVGSVVQKRKRFTAKSLLGSGKIDEIKELALEHSAGLIVFDRPLSPPQSRNIEQMTCLAVMDRTGIIIDIFGQHARTNEAKTQVEIARLQYLLPRMVGAWTHFSRQAGGGMMNRGMGETQIEIDRRRARDRIMRLQKQLEQFKVDQQTQRKARSKELSVALVGYTNSGKSTLMNQLTEGDVLVEDKLFASLEARVKTLDPKARPRLLLTDTVGFIRNLPHSLIESFRSTLDEATNADLLLHVIDISHPNYKKHIEVTLKTLDDIGASDIPSIYIFNKVDKVDDPVFQKILKASYKNSVFLSAYDKKGVVDLKKTIQRFFENNLITVELTVDETDLSLISDIYRNCVVLDVRYREDFEKAIYQVQLTKLFLEKYKDILFDERNIRT